MYSINTALKKILLIILIAVLTFSQLGYYLLMRDAQFSQKEAVKEEIKNNLKDEELEIISFTDNKLNIFWEEEEKEFLLNGEMYDVVKTKTVNGKQLLYCINDKKEKSLVDNYNTITKHNSSADKKGKVTIDDVTNLFVYTEEINCRQDYELFLNHYSSYVSHLPGSFTDKISPPPKA